MNKFEQLIEYVINDDDAKARELFHDIVVEKSREIYENLMNEENLEEESEHEKDEHAEKAGRKVTKDIEYDEKHHKMDEGMEESAMGGDAADDLMHEVDMEETGMAEDDEAADHEAEEAGHELTHDMEAAHDEADLEDRVVDLEDKLDELMAEFESLMGGEDSHDDLDGEDMADMAGDALAVDDTEEMMAENIDLKAAPAPVKSEESFVNKKPVYAANSGQAGMEGKPVNPDVGGEEKGRPAPTTKELIGKTQNRPATGSKSMEPAPKPHLAQATGVNTTTPFPKG